MQWRESQGRGEGEREGEDTRGRMWIKSLQNNEVTLRYSLCLTVVLQSRETQVANCAQIFMHSKDTARRFLLTYFLHAWGNVLCTVHNHRLS